MPMQEWWPAWNRQLFIRVAAAEWLLKFHEPGTFVFPSNPLYIQFPSDCGHDEPNEVVENKKVSAKAGGHAT